MIAGVLDSKSQKQSRINFIDDLLNGVCDLASVGLLEIGLEFLVHFLALMRGFHAQSGHDIGFNVVEGQVMQFFDWHMLRRGRTEGELFLCILFVGSKFLAEGQNAFASICFILK